MGKKLALSHILVEQRYEAEDVLRKLEAGEEFESLARKFSKCSSAKQGGDLGTIDLDRLDSEFADAAERLAPGEISGAVRTRFGTHIIKRRDA
jgi:parvulin-like peptidyl-prolyl isomerase